MNLLLDTHVLLWWIARDGTLSEPARAAISDPAAQIFVSAATAWEIAIKQSIGKLDVPSDLAEQMERHQHGLALAIGFRRAIELLQRDFAGTLRAEGFDLRH